LAISSWKMEKWSDFRSLSGDIEHTVPTPEDLIWWNPQK